MGKLAPTRQQVGAVLASVAVLLGSGGGAGYYLHGAEPAPPTPTPALSLERLVEVEKWKAAETALRERDRSERSEMLVAIRENNITNVSLREAVITMTERMGIVTLTQRDFDVRLRAVESWSSTRPASGKR